MKRPNERTVLVPEAERVLALSLEFLDFHVGFMRAHFEELLLGFEVHESGFLVVRVAAFELVAVDAEALAEVAFPEFASSAE